MDHVKKVLRAPEGSQGAITTQQNEFQQQQKNSQKQNVTHALEKNRKWKKKN